MGLWAWTLNSMLTPKFAVLLRREGKVNLVTQDFGKLTLECTELNLDRVIMLVVRMVQFRVQDRINLEINIMKTLM